MEDHQILDLYFQRSEQAIQETDTKYGNYCFRIAYQSWPAGRMPRKASAIPTWQRGTPYHPKGRRSCRHFWGGSPGTYPLTVGEPAAHTSEAEESFPCAWKS